MKRLAVASASGFGGLAYASVPTALLGPFAGALVAFWAFVATLTYLTVMGTIVGDSCHGTVWWGAALPQGTVQNGMYIASSLIPSGSAKKTA
jgi:hypothetical protein